MNSRLFEIEKYIYWLLCDAECFSHFRVILVIFELGTVHFLWGRGAGGIWEAPFKNRMTPPQLTNFFHMAPPYSGHFLGWPPPKINLNKQYLDFNFFNISLLSPYFTLLCSLWRQYLQSLYYRELLFKKHKSKEREVNFGSPSYGSPWACGIWPLIGIFLIWIDECKNDITWVIFSPRVNGITVILIIVTFIRFTAVSTCPVVILCQCPGISQCWLASSERTLLLQAWMSYNCLDDKNGWQAKHDSYWSR